jgi:hypothetical protein
MTTPQTDQTQTEPKNNDKEVNFAQLRQKYERELASKNAQIEEMQRAAQTKPALQDEDDDDSDPYIDKKRLRKEQAKLSQNIKQETQGEIQKAVHMALSEERKQNWLKANNDFYDVLQHADKFAQQDPELAETILQMPEGFERQKLVYKSIKSLGLHKPEVKQASVQDKIDANKKSPYYQPSGVGASPYSQVGDFSKTGQEQAYKKMKELQNRLR